MTLSDSTDEATRTQRELNFIPSHRRTGDTRHACHARRWRSHSAMGPLTNVALAAKHDPDTSAKVGRVTSMGAALRVPGNQTTRAEFSIYGDPETTALLYNLSSLTNHKPCRMASVPLDLTMSHQLTEEEFTAFSAISLKQARRSLSFLQNVLGPAFARSWAFWRPYTGVQLSARGA